MLTATFRVRRLGRIVLTGPALATISQLWGTFRDVEGIGASAMSGGNVLDGKRFVGKMSYNGRVWPKRTWTAGDKPIF
jgi:hypothetical protein